MKNKSTKPQDKNNLTDWNIDLTDWSIDLTDWNKDITLKWDKIDFEGWNLWQETPKKKKSISVDNRIDISKNIDLKKNNRRITEATKTKQEFRQHSTLKKGEVKNEQG